MFKKVFTEKKVPENLNPYPEGATPKEMEELGKCYLEKHDFSPGQLVQWKEGMKACRLPKYGHPAVVLEVEPGRRSSCDYSKENLVNQPEDVRIGVFSNGWLSGIWIDGNRLEPFVPQF